jgi:AbrB family looped-hinge helix DNA binding protein
MKSTISSKGQITVPVELRDLLGLRAGTVVVFEKHPRGALLRKGSVGSHPVDRVFGSLDLGAGTDVVMDRLRGPRLDARRPVRRGK